jgi:hypothetical protein
MAARAAPISRASAADAPGNISSSRSRTQNPIIPAPICLPSVPVFRNGTLTHSPITSRACNSQSSFPRLENIPRPTNFLDKVRSFPDYFPVLSPRAAVAELADARDLKSLDGKLSYRFDPGQRHHFIFQFNQFHFYRARDCIDFRNLRLTVPVFSSFFLVFPCKSVWIAAFLPLLNLLVILKNLVVAA